MFVSGPDTRDARRRVVIVGGGVAGLDLAGILGRDPALDVILLDHATSHVWKPMLHSIAAGTHDVAQVEVPYVAQARHHGFTYVPGRVDGIDPVTRTIGVAPFSFHGRELLPQRTIDYDTLVLAIGSVAAHFDVAGVEEHARHIDTLAEARDFQAHVAPRLVEAAQTGVPLRVAIVGGGATGVQLAAELVQIADIADDYGLGGGRKSLDITLVDRGDRLLPAFPERISSAARTRLEGLGITVRTGVDVSAVHESGLQLEDEVLPADLCVWAAGVEAAPLAATLDTLQRMRNGRVVVDNHCRSISSPDIFAIGDCAAFGGSEDGSPLPPTAQVAFQQAVYLGRWLPTIVLGEKAPAFRYRDLGALVQLGGYDAYGALGQFGIFGRGFLRGRVAQAGHAFLYRRHQMRLHGIGPALRLWLAERIAGKARPSSKLS
ncbi:NAD(P)/FAD-dependent oxidoreductase [Sphingomonas adhaesiva]|uniref:NAD(P)/FAD-dependent oxidoreductase n=1 Tax=Sphingomonas adhaesiva TaxID=28212 RepID=UPI002FF97F2F